MERDQTNCNTGGRGCLPLYIESREVDIMEIITRADLRDYIRIVKKTLGWTYEDLAKATGINASTLANYGAGRFPKNQEQALDVVERIRKAAAEEQRRRRGLSA